MESIVEEIEQEEITTSPTGEWLRAIGPWAFSLIILAGYIVFIVYLIGKSQSSNEEWVKLTYIFSSIEAIVFTAVGFIFGREVHKARAVSAEVKEKKAVKEKKKLAEEILKKIPPPPVTPTPSTTSSPKHIGVPDTENLRRMAEFYVRN